MGFLRLLLPSYKKTIEYFSNGKGYGKKKYVKKILSFFNFIFKSSFVDVRGQKMYLIKGFEEYATVGVYGVLDTHIVESLIKPGDYAIDVGAAIGYFTLIFAKLVGKKNGLVIAFEPKTERFEILTKNVNVNNYENVKLEKKAILKDDGSSTFFSLSDGAGLHFVANSDEFINESNSFKQKIPKEVSTVNLDKYLEDLDILKKISFMKIDVDGPELLVLQSSELLLQNSDLKILIEWDVSSSKRCKCNPETLIDILLKNNFKIFYPDYKRNRFFQVSKNELLTMPTNVNETINLICVKDLSILKKISYFEI
jgi:FkbM family methyltransferase